MAQRERRYYIGIATANFASSFFQVLSRRSSADFLAVVNFVLRFSPGEVQR